jgi:hypothetical protein
MWSVANIELSTRWLNDFMDQDNLSNSLLWTELVVQAIKAYFLHKCWYIKVNGAYGGWYWFQSKRMEMHVYQYMLSDGKFSAISVSQQSPSSNNFSLIYSNSWLSTNTQTSSHNVSFNCTLSFGKLGNKWQILVTSQHACSISVADKEQINKHRWEVQRLNHMGFCGELKIGTLRNSINRVNFMAETTIDALCHVNVIPVITSYDLVI